MKKYYSFKKINKPALLYGLPFTIFFAILVWTIILGFSIFSVKGNMLKLILAIIMLAGNILIFVIYVKFGLAKILKMYDLFFRDIHNLKYNKPLKIKKIKNDNK